MDLGLTTFQFLIINFILMILGIAKFVIAVILIGISTFSFTPMKGDTFCACVSNATIYGLNEIAIFVLGILAGNKNNVRFLNRYLVFILILILSKCYTLYHIHEVEDRIKKDMNFSLTDAMTDLRAEIDTSLKVDDIQRNLQCCGTDGPGFWTKKNSSFPIPKSCCPSKIDSCNISNAYQSGCYKKIIATLPYVILKIHRWLMMPVCETILFFIGAILVIMIMKTASNSLA